MSRWVAVHIDGRYGSVDTELVTEIRAVDPRDPTHHGTILTLRDGTTMQIDEALLIARILFPA